MSVQELDLTFKEIKKTCRKRKRTVRSEENGDVDTSNSGREQRTKAKQDKGTTAIKGAAVLKTRMSPMKLKKLLSNLTEEQKSSVREIGFGPLLEFQLSSWDNKLNTYLVQNFDVYRCALKLENEEMLLTEDDVESTLGLPRGNIEIVEGNISTATKAYDNLVEEWRTHWGIGSCSPLVKIVSQGIIEKREHGDMFKRAFVVFVVSSLFKGHANRTINFKVLYSLLDVNNIKNLNWCGYIFKALIETVEKWKKTPNTFFTGPLIFLVLSYLDRLQFKGQRIQRRYPAISTWTVDMIQKRFLAERESGGYGRGKVFERITKSTAETEENIGEEKVEKDEGGVCEEAAVSDVQKVSRGLKKLTAAVAEFGVVMAQVSSSKTGKNIVKKTFSKISDMLNVASTSRPTQDSSLLDDPIFSDVSFLAAIAELEEAFTKITTTACPVLSPNWDLLTPTPPEAQKTPEPTTAAAEIVTAEEIATYTVQETE